MTTYKERRWEEAVEKMKRFDKNLTDEQRSLIKTYNALQAQKGLDGTIVRREFAKGTSRFWLTPPKLYKALDSEFHFTFDPFPYPRPDGWDALKMDWGMVNYVNPPFSNDNGIRGVDYARKAIEESRKGKTIVIAYPIRSFEHYLLEAGAEVRTLGRVRWLDVDSKEPMKAPNLIGLFILRGYL